MTKQTKDIHMPKQFEFWYQATVLGNHDGDTMALRLDMGRRIYIEDSIRLYRINAPELSQSGGKKARDYLSSICPIGSTVRVQTFKNHEDKYGRWLGDIYSEQNGIWVCLNDLMVETGHAKYLP